ncbi:MAG: DUF2249 domain-containing protein [Chloroflexota bacterium]
MSSSDQVQGNAGECECSHRAQIVRGASPARELDSPPGAANEISNGAARSIDVSHLPPPLPMVRILETLREMGPGQSLLVSHTRRPIHLYPKLEALGCTHETTELPGGKIQVRITNPSARA